MDIETLRKAADVLGVLTDHLRTMPEEIQEDICQAMKQYEACDELSTHKQYEEIEKLWRKGTLILGMHEIAENTGMEISSLMQLSENEKLDSCMNMRSVRIRTNLPEWSMSDEAVYRGNAALFV